MPVPARDPYVLDDSLIAEPPTTLAGSLRYLGPGLVLTASIVGSGELIATTVLGARAGFVALWVILLSCLVKVTLQLEFGRMTIQTGETCFAAFNKIPGPKLLGNHWTIWLWLLVQPLKILQVGGVIGGTAQVLHMLVPSLPASVWCWLTALVAAVLISRDSYQIIERVSLGLILAFTFVTLGSVASLPWTPYAIAVSDVAAGLTFHLPGDTATLLAVFGAFGLTGVGGDEIMQYTYWLIEKGYAAKTGRRREGDPAWARRARGWIRVMYFDALASMVVYTAVTAAFFILGAAVLHRRGEVPAGFATVETLATMYTESLGPWAAQIFLVGALAVLFSTVVSALGAWTRIFSDCAGRFGLIDFADLRSRRRSIVALAWFFPLVWSALYLWYQEPVLMVNLGGVVTAAILVAVIAGAIHFRYARTAPELRPGRVYDLALWGSIATIATLGGQGIFKTLQAVAG